MNAVTPSADLPMSGAQILLRALKEQGVEVIFGYPGGAVLPIYDAIFQQNAIRHILVRHEQAAVHAAEGYARSTGRVGVVLVTSGPGATNAVTGLVDALMDSIPVVCLTGQVPTHLIGNDAFQEADTVGITRPATKHNYLVKKSDDLARVVHEAFYVARSGRPGPVVIDLPKDILINPAPYVPASKEAHRSYRPRTEPDPAQIDKAVALIRAAKRPVLYVGGGDRHSLHQYADGSGHPARQRPAFHRHAGDARDLRGQHGYARLRRDAEHRRPLR
jgi:acetolactate synthase-1/2/3 large subunit